MLSTLTLDAFFRHLKIWRVSFSQKIFGGYLNCIENKKQFSPMKFYLLTPKMTSIIYVKLHRHSGHNLWKGKHKKEKKGLIIVPI